MSTVFRFSSVGFKPTIYEPTGLKPVEYSGMRKVTLYTLFAASVCFVSALAAAIGFDVAQPSRQFGSAGHSITLYTADRGLTARIDPESVALQLGQATVSLHLAEFQAGIHRLTLKAEQPTLKDGWVNLAYSHGLSAWYAKRGSRIEQGFSLRRPPVPHATSVMLVFDVSGILRPRLLDHQNLEFVGPHGQPVIRYTDLVVYDAGHQVLPASITLTGNRLGLEVDTRGAVYPVTVDPDITAEVHFTDPDDRIGDNFGEVVALSADGSTALIGAISATLNGVCIGKAYVYTQVNGAWSTTPTTVFDNPDTTTGECGFGSAVTLSADGSVALIGAPTNPLYPTNNTRLYVYTRTNGAWSPTPTATFMNPDANDEDCFSCSVALSSDGTIALIGAPGTAVNGSTSAGAAYIFTQSNGIWSTTPVAVVTDPGARQDDGFGSGLALSGDGTTALIGTDQLFPDRFGGSRAFIFTATNGVWLPVPSATFDDPVNEGFDSFGASVALSTAGTSALIGAYGANNAVGVAYMYTLAGTTWSTVPTAIFDNPNATAGDNFGWSVALSGDGTTALVDVLGSDNNYVFTQIDGLWAMTPAATLSPGFESTSVALSSSGTLALIGTPQTPGPIALGVSPGGGPGQAYVYENTNGWSSPPTNPAPVTSGGSGGGGVFGLLSLGALLGMLLRRKYLG
ncbi:MAG: hypothetical protein WBR29_13065 [Gammaproteobacteria bacterium]